MPHKLLARGDVVVRGGCKGIVWIADSSDTVHLLPVAENEGPLRRGDVVIEDWVDLAAIGAGPDIKVRCDCQQRASARGQEVVGRLSESMIRCLERAAARSAESEKFEGVWAGVAAVERLMRAEKAVALR